MRKVLIVGATSAIVNATARCFASEGDRLFLVARNSERLEQVADDLRARGAADVHCHVMDANDFAAHAAMIDAAREAMGGLDTVLIGHGTLSDQQACQQSVERTFAEFNTNCLSYLSLLTLLGNHFEQQKHGVIAVISSVAGLRGRQSNYVYGAAKAAVIAFTQGLRNRLAKHGVAVVDVRPGFVDTPMTAHFDKGLLWAKPKQVGARIHKAMVRGEDIVYAPFFWRWIMLIIRLIPEAVFKRLSL
ncbi:MAG: SDR family oxidoreductase [Zetaproteobacteria bacterium]|nr:MAG: SDR family oxidoreductase [Zetaproteobacteria bacterium]